MFSVREMCTKSVYLSQAFPPKSPGENLEKRLKNDTSSFFFKALSYAQFTYSDQFTIVSAGAFRVQRKTEKYPLK